MKQLWFNGYEEEAGVITEYDVASIPNDFNINTIFNLIDSERITLPLFQRHYVWDKKRASKLIESIIQGLPIPPIFLYQEDRDKFKVIDGQQRLLTIYFFIKRRFPRQKKRGELRKIFDEKGKIPESVLGDDIFFEDFKLDLPVRDSIKKHPLHNLNYLTLGAYKEKFEYQTLRCVTIRQLSPKDDDSSIIEIFNRLNTGGVNLAPQEIRMSLYFSDFYEMLLDLNRDERWRRLLNKPDVDDGMRDIEFLLRGFAFAIDYQSYKSSMLNFLNSFSKKMMKSTPVEIRHYKGLFNSFFECISGIDADGFSTKRGQFNVALFDCAFAAICSPYIRSDNLPTKRISKESLLRLKEDGDFLQAISHSTSHRDSVKTRMEKAQSLLI